MDNKKQGTALLQFGFGLIIILGSIAMGLYHIKADFLNPTQAAMWATGKEAFVSIFLELFRAIMVLVNVRIRKINERQGNFVIAMSVLITLGISIVHHQNFKHEDAQGNEWMVQVMNWAILLGEITFSLWLAGNGFNIIEKIRTIYEGTPVLNSELPNHAIPLFRYVETLLNEKKIQANKAEEALAAKQKELEQETIAKEAEAKTVNLLSQELTVAQKFILACLEGVAQEFIEVQGVENEDWLRLAKLVATGALVSETALSVGDQKYIMTCEGKRPSDNCQPFAVSKSALYGTKPIVCPSCGKNHDTEQMKSSKMKERLSTFVEG